MAAISITSSLKRLTTSSLLRSNPFFGLNFNTQFKALIHLSSFPLKVTTFKLADIGEGITEVELLKWHKSVGDVIEEMDELCEIQSDKAAVEITSRFSGKILKFYKNPGDFIKIGSPLADIETEGAEESKIEEVIEDTPSTITTSSSSLQDNISSKDQVNSVKASPATRRFAKEMNVDLYNVIGTGKDGRIEKVDIENFLKNTNQTVETTKPSSANTATSTLPSTPVVLSTPTKENYDVVLRGFPKAMFKSMTETAKIPHMNIGESINITQLLSMKQNMKEVVKKQYGMNFTITPIIIKAISTALLKHPILNSKVDNSGEKYTVYGSHNVSIAIDTPNGLVVPNIKNVQDLTMIQIQSELIRLQKLAETNKLSAADLTGGTVSISNVGVIGGTLVKSLLFDGQAMIIATGRTQKLPRFDSKGNVVAQDIIDFAISADHRHCDGATVAKFISELRTMLENPEIMLMNL